MKASTHIVTVVCLFLLAIALTWWIRGEWKDREFAAKATHSRDTSSVTTETPVPPVHANLGPLPAVTPKEKKPAVDSAIARAERSGGVDSLKGVVRYIAAPVDTTVRRDSSGSVRVQYDPLERMMVIDLKLPPRRETDTTIRDSVSTPIIEHDSFETRATIFSAGAAVAAIVILLAM